MGTETHQLPAYHETNIMDPDQIRNWRPSRFSEVVGADNQRRIRRLQRKLLKGRLPTPLMLVGVYGYGKTSLARLLLKSLCCEHRNPVTADPCSDCQWCRCFGKIYNGYGQPYRRCECDCTTLNRTQLIEVLDEHRFEDDVALFMDEFHHLHEKRSQEAMLKFVEDFDGLLITAIMEDRLEEVIPPLRERFEVIRMSPPEEHEMVEFFTMMSDAWKVRTKHDVLHFMVKESGKSFRFGIKAHAAAADEPDRTLTESLIQDLLGI
ncbi:MAG: AAA family ATPase [Planctomycetaceae bacterium]|nr:AAA family ATPase [Planctomycetaceae bacterium]